MIDAVTGYTVTVRSNCPDFLCLGSIVSTIDSGHYEALHGGQKRFEKAGMVG